MEYYVVNLTRKEVPGFTNMEFNKKTFLKDFTLKNLSTVIFGNDINIDFFQSIFSQKISDNNKMFVFGFENMLDFSNITEDISELKNIFLMLNKNSCCIFLKTIKPKNSFEEVGTYFYLENREDIHILEWLKPQFKLKGVFINKSMLNSLSTIEINWLKDSFKEVNQFGKNLIEINKVNNISVEKEDILISLSIID